MGGSGDRARGCPPGPPGAPAMGAAPAAAGVLLHALSTLAVAKFNVLRGGGAAGARPTRTWVPQESSWPQSHPWPDGDCCAGVATPKPAPLPPPAPTPLRPLPPCCPRPLAVLSGGARSGPAPCPDRGHTMALSHGVTMAGVGSGGGRGGVPLPQRGAWGATSSHWQGHPWPGLPSSAVGVGGPQLGGWGSPAQGAAAWGPQLGGLQRGVPSLGVGTGGPQLGGLQHGVPSLGGCSVGSPAWGPGSPPAPAHPWGAAPPSPVPRAQRLTGGRLTGDRLPPRQLVQAGPPPHHPPPMGIKLGVPQPPQSPCTPRRGRHEEPPGGEYERVGPSAPHLVARPTCVTPHVGVRPLHVTPRLGARPRLHHPTPGGQTPLASPHSWGCSSQVHRDSTRSPPIPGAVGHSPTSITPPEGPPQLCAGWGPTQLSTGAVASWGVGGDPHTLSNAPPRGGGASPMWDPALWGHHPEWVPAPLCPCPTSIPAPWGAQ